MRFTFARVFCAILFLAILGVIGIKSRTESALVAQEKAKKPPVPQTAKKEAEDLTAQTEEKLKQYVSANYKDVSINDFLADIRKRFDVQVYVNEESLRTATLDPATTKISIELPHVQARMLLELALRQRWLDFYVRDGILMVGTREFIDTYTETRLYDCRAILRTNTPNPHYQPTRAVGGGAITLDHSLLVDILTGSISPQSWCTRGGPGTIDEFGDILIINQTYDVHRRIADLLQQLTRAIDSKPTK